MTTQNNFIDLSKAVDPTKAPNVNLKAWGFDASADERSNDQSSQKILPSPFEAHGRKGTLVILLAGALYMSTVLFMVYLAKAALG